MAAFRFADLFAGIGGFHAVLSALGGEATFVSELDPLARSVYERNWGARVEGDLVPLTERRMAVPPHDVLVAGFPCQPFSKSGWQRGMSEARGTLFWNICRVLEKRRPAVFLLENVRNLAGPRHAHEWEVIVRSLRDLGYRVPSRPAVVSPHHLPPELGGRPQARERVFILGTYVGKRRAWSDRDVSPIAGPRAVPIAGWDPRNWDLERHLPLEADSDIGNLESFQLNEAENLWLDVWEEFLERVRPNLENGRLPGFPIWSDEFRLPAEVVVTEGMPKWKVDFLRKNAAFYAAHKTALDPWLERVRELPASRRKFEWQAQDPTTISKTVLHFRPSGIRVKRPTYLPALVALTQTSVIGWRRRRITPREAARLQGLPDWFSFGEQPDAATYRQLGNGVNVGAAYYVFRQHVLRDIEEIARRAPDLAESAARSSPNPDDVLAGAIAPARRGPHGSCSRVLDLREGVSRPEYSPSN